MNILIIAEDIKRGLFLKRGLQFENLNAKLIHVSEMEELSESCSQYRCIIWAAGLGFGIDRLYDQQKIANPPVRFILLSPNFSEETVDYSRRKSLKIYFRPYPLRIIANEIKQGFMADNFAGESKYTIRDLELNVNSHRVLFKNREIYLRNKEFNLLYYLMANQGKILTRDMIIENVWDMNAEIITNTVEVHISNLRKKIDKKSITKYIYTIPCNGYMLN